MAKKNSDVVYRIQDGDEVRDMTPEEAANYDIARQDRQAEAGE